MKKTVIELFAGVGGFRCGLNKVEFKNDKVIENGNWNFVWANQWEPSTKSQEAFECYSKRFGDKDVSNVDIFEVNKKEILSREALEIDVTPQVKEIIDDVRKRGDEALFDYTYRFDNAKLESLLVTKEEILEALNKTDKEFIRILEKAKKRITNYHEKQKRNSFIISEENGVILGQKIVPLERVGIYVPGGSAQYPSTVLMDAIPAKIAGCKEIIMVTPPKKDGSVDPSILAACYIAGVDKIYKVGGAQAIAALAYGTETIKKVDKIVGPGNIFVATAKKMVSSTVSIDMVAGPSEILIIAEDNSSSRILASDLLSQAEHDKNATSVLLTTSLSVAKETQKEVESFR